jgi:hypothetical protein
MENHYTLYYLNENLESRETEEQLVFLVLTMELGVVVHEA